MKSADSNFGDIRREDRAMIQAAARRAGLSVSEWLDSVIKSAAKHGRQPPRSVTDPDSRTPERPEPTMSALHERIEHLAGQMEQLLQQNRVPAAHLPNPTEGIVQLRRLEDAINRLCDRLQSCLVEVPFDRPYSVDSTRPRLFSRLIAPRS